MSDIIPNPSGTCQVDWCGEPGGHAGNHRRILGEVTCPEYNKASAILVSVEAAPAETDPLPVLTLVSRLGITLETVRLDWAANSRLVSLLGDAASRFS